MVLAGSGLVALAIYALVHSLQYSIPPDNYPNRPKISVSRLIDCGMGCPDLNSTGMISNYPSLKEGLNQADAKYVQKFNDNDCYRNDCRRDLFLNDTIDFTMPRDRALRMTYDLIRYGAENENVCLEGDCYALEFGVSQDAIYRVEVDYRN